MNPSVTISIEIELAWGYHDKDGPDICSPDRSAEEAYLKRLLRSCDEYDIPITFDVVGHLLLESCDGRHGGSREEWFEADPGTDAARSPLFYWPEVGDVIWEADIDHEIGTHTFSHVLCDEVDEGTLRLELSECARAHDAAGLPRPTSFVAPRHRPVPYDLIRAVGIDAVRVPARLARLSKAGRYAQRAVGWTYRRGHPAFLPARNGGVLETYTTTHPSLTAVHLPNGQLKPPAFFRAVPLRLRQRFQRSYLDGAIRTARRREANTHLWTHLYNLANEEQWECIEPFLHRLGDARDAGEVEVHTMADLAACV